MTAPEPLLSRENRDLLFRPFAGRGHRLWLLCAACRRGDTGVYGIRAAQGKMGWFLWCTHRHPQKWIRRHGIGCDRGVAGPVARLNDAGFETFASCEGPPRRLNVIGVRDGDAMLAVLGPGWRVTGTYPDVTGGLIVNVEEAG